MPILIEVRKNYTNDQKEKLMDAVFSALCETFKIPSSNKIIRIITHDPHCFACPPNLTYPERYTFISIDCFAGRSLNSKRNLYQMIAQNLLLLDIPKDHVNILLRETTPENWGTRSGQAACDIELGYKIDI